MFNLQVLFMLIFSTEAKDIRGGQCIDHQQKLEKFHTAVLVDLSIPSSVKREIKKSGLYIIDQKIEIYRFAASKITGN